MSSLSRGNPRDRNKKGATIIRRSIKKGHGGHHGGAWKVAFADFTLAMMALFMTLWIVNSVSEKERKDIVAALHDQSIFSGNGIMPLNNLNKFVLPSSTPKPDVNATPAPEPKPQQALLHTPKETTKEHDAAKPVDPQIAEKTASVSKLLELAKLINAIAEKSHMQSNLEIEIVPQGLRVLIKDDKNRDMFERSSARINPFFRKLLTELAPVFDSLDNRLIITGHTDSLQYKNSLRYNNWNLSGDRALSARRVLEEAGMPGDKVMQVSAMSDGMLLNSDDPDSAENRRIEIMVLTKSASDSLYQFFGDKGENVVKPVVARIEAQK